MLRLAQGSAPAAESAHGETITSCLQLVAAGAVLSETLRTGREHHVAAVIGRAGA
jgi:hypothetical protein